MKVKMSEKLKAAILIGLTICFGWGCSKNDNASSSSANNSQSVDEKPVSTTRQKRPKRQATSQASGRSRSTDVKFPKNTLADQSNGFEVTIGRIMSWVGNENGQVVGGPVVQLHLSGSKTNNATRLRTMILEVRDPAGNPMVEKKDLVMPENASTFHTLKKPFGIPLGDGEKKNLFDAGKFRYKLANDMTQIKTFSGEIELFTPDRDPSSVVNASFKSDLESPLSDDVIRSAGATIKLKKPNLEQASTIEMMGQKMKTYTFGYQLTDPAHKVAAIEIVDGNGKPFVVLSTMSMGTSPSEVSLTVRSPTKPENASLKIYVATDKAVVRVPFEFRDIPLNNFR